MTSLDALVHLAALGMGSYAVYAVAATAQEIYGKTKRKPPPREPLRAKHYRPPPVPGIPRVEQRPVYKDMDHRHEAIRREYFRKSEAAKYQRDAGLSTPFDRAALDRARWDHYLKLAAEDEFKAELFAQTIQWVEGTEPEDR